MMIMLKFLGWDEGSCSIITTAIKKTKLRTFTAEWILEFS